LKLNLFEEAVSGYKNCLTLNDDDITIYIALVDVLLFLGDFNEALSTLFKAQRIYKDFAEIEYRLAGIFFILNKEKFGKKHLIDALKIDFEYHSILNELFPILIENLKIQKFIIDFKKATE
jgi:tetratricopeptide (TPR) repeat protein